MMRTVNKSKCKASRWWCESGAYSLLKRTSEISSESKYDERFPPLWGLSGLATVN